MWLHFRTEGNLTGARPLCYRAKIGEICKPQFYHIKVGCNRYTLHGHDILMRSEIDVRNASFLFINFTLKLLGTFSSFIWVPAKSRGC